MNASRFKFNSTRLTTLTAKFTSSFLATSFEIFKLVFPFHTDWNRPSCALNEKSTYGGILEIGKQWTFKPACIKRWKQLLSEQCYNSQMYNELWLENENWICWLEQGFVTLLQWLKKLQCKINLKVIFHLRILRSEYGSWPGCQSGILK